MNDSQSTPTTLVELLEGTPTDRVAVIAPEGNLKVTYGELRNQVLECAEALAGAGVKRGDRIGIALPNGLPHVVILLAAAMAGIAAPLNPSYKEDEFLFYLEDTRARFLVLPHEGLAEARRAAGDKYTIITVDLDESGRVRTSSPTRAPFGPPSINDVALILHTSGSTGRPKRVPLSHANLTISARNVAGTYELGPTDVSLCVMPLFHVHGMVASTLATLASGGTVVVPARFNPLSFWRLAADFGATWYSAVPTIHQLLVSRSSPEAGRPAGAQRLRFIRSCSAPLAPRLMSDLEDAFGAPVLEAYGMTEAAHQMASNPLPPASRQPGSVGRSTGTTQIRTMDAAGRILKAGERGEVVIRGANVFTGYEGNPETNTASFADGWFRTGDQGFLDEAGGLTLTGRLKEMIIRGGEKISPLEVDEVLLAHPLIAEAVAFGVPHATWGEEVVAAVVLTSDVEATEAELISYCKEKLADFKRPKQIFITSAIPRTATGKILRRTVADAFSAAVKRAPR